MTFISPSPFNALPAPVSLRARHPGSQSPAPVLHSADKTYANLATSYDAARKLFWCDLQPRGRACFSPALLQDIAEMHAALRAEVAPVGSPATADSPMRYFVCASSVPGTFNLGGDLGLFQALIAAGDLAGLRRYGHACIQAIYNSYTAMDLPVVTIALVQGDALGGGFECALAHDVIVAERSAKLGLPEVLFNLFPGMGAYSFLSRRIGRVAAERLILGGKVMTAEELHEMGLVDILAADGEGKAALLDFVDANDRWHNARLATYRARRRVDPVTLQELRDVVDIWAEAAAQLGAQDLRRMARLASAQDRRIGSGAAPLH